MLSAGRPASPLQAGARALYLGGAVPKRVGCTEQALVVTNARAQTWRYPVARVARVVSSPAVDWSGAALSLCMHRGISIAWTDAKGQALGVCYAQQRGQIANATALEVLLEAPCGSGRYDNWRRRCRLAILKRWAAGQPGGVTPQAWESRKRQWVYAGEFDEHLPAELRPLCLAFVAGVLQRQGMPAVWWDAEARRIDLDEDLCLLAWADMNLCTGNLADTGEGERPLTELFERWAGRNGATVLGHLHALERLALKALHE